MGKTELSPTAGWEAEGLLGTGRAEGKPRAGGAAALLGLNQPLLRVRMVEKP